MKKEKFRFYAFKLTGIMVLVFLVQVMVSGFSDSFVLNGRAWDGEYFRFLSAVFLHGGLGHLMYNGFALVLFGSILERLIGGKKFLMVFFISGILANMFSVNFYSSSLGASGAIFGVIGAIAVIRPWLPVWAFGMPMPMIIAGVLWVTGDVIGIFVPDNVGNIAHLSGMFFGIVLGRLYKVRKRQKFKKPKIRISERRMREWEEGYLIKLF